MVTDWRPPRKCPRCGRPFLGSTRICSKCLAIAAQNLAPLGKKSEDLNRRKAGVMPIGIINPEQSRLLRRMQEDIEYLIMGTPTGALRDLFTEVNMKILQIQGSTLTTRYQGPSEYAKPGLKPK